jgi:hypothetical protein
MPDRSLTVGWMLLLLLPLSAATAEIVQEIAVTSRGREHGAVRLLRRDDALIVQTLLDSKVLRQVVGRIRKLELANWPEGAEGYAASQRYLQGLDEALAAAYLAPPDDDRRRQLAIEFGLSPSMAWVAFSPESRVELPRAYVSRNMLLIAADRGLDRAPDLLDGR